MLLLCQASCACVRPSETPSSQGESPCCHWHRLSLRPLLKPCIIPHVLAYHFHSCSGPWTSVNTLNLGVITCRISLLMLLKYADSWEGLVGWHVVHQSYPAVGFEVSYIMLLLLFTIIDSDY